MKAGAIISRMINNRKFYLMEAAGIGGFVMLAGATTIFLEHPSLPVMQTWLWHHPFLRRVLLGIVMGIYVAGTVKLFGKLSGTHVNPSVTFVFCRLGNIHLADAFGYILFQFAGALAGLYGLIWLAGAWFAYPSIDYGVSKPQPAHTLMGAFIAEFMISFLLMAVVLFLSSSRKGEKYIAVSIGFLLAAFIIVELPYSGMSMNPARSFAAAFGAKEWTHLWVYFVSPPLAMLTAAELFIIWKKKRIAQANRDHKEIGVYPVKKNHDPAG